MVLAAAAMLATARREKKLCILGVVTKERMSAVVLLKRNEMMRTMEECAVAEVRYTTQEANEVANEWARLHFLLAEPF